MDATTETTALHLTSEYGAAAHELDELFHDWTVLSNHAESLDWQNEDANERAAAAWNVYENERMAALVAMERAAKGPGPNAGPWIIGSRRFAGEWVREQATA